MLGREDYTQEELDHAKMAVDQQRAAYTKLVRTIANSTEDKKVDAALATFEALFFNNALLQQHDPRPRPFLRASTSNGHGQGRQPAQRGRNAQRFLDEQQRLRGNNVIKYVPDVSVVKLSIGDPIRLTAKEFEHLSAAFFTEIERRFLPGSSKRR